MQARIWAHMTVEELRHAMGQTQTVLIPLGITEQHGYHLPLDTDSHNAYEMCVGASEQTGCLVAPTLPYAYSGGELAGTINIATPIYAAFVMEILRDLARQGMRSLILAPGHGGSENTQAIDIAADMFQRTNPCYSHCTVAVYKFWECVPSFIAAFEEGDYHAGQIETSLMMHWVPDEVRMDRRVKDDPAALSTGESPAQPAHPAVVPPARWDPRVQVGVSGDPTRATAAKGEQAFREMVESLVQIIRALESDSQ
jgi:creatinine amidohydrolase